MGQVLQADAQVVVSVTSATVITMAANVAQTIGGGQFVTPVVTCTTTTSGAGGLDTGSIAINTLYYLYLVRVSGVISLVASINSTSPTGFPAFKRIGQASTNASSQWSAAGNSVTTDTGRIGQIMSAMLSETQWQAIHGNSWILADGRSVAGSNYATVTGSSVAPDLRGLALRGKNNGRSDGNQNPDGDLALGVFQGDTMGSHTHQTNLNTPGNAGGGPLGSSAPTTYPSVLTGSGELTTFRALTSAAGGGETRMRNATVNHFIKIN